MYFLHIKTILFREVCFLLFLFNIISDNCFENFFLFFSLLLILPCNCCVPTFPANVSFIFGCAVQFSHSVVSDSLRPHGLQHARLPCPSPAPRAYLNSFPSCWWCHPTISHPLLSPSPPAFNLSQHHVFSSESVLCIRWPEYQSFSFSISSSNDYSGLISFRIDWFGSPCSPRDSQESSPTTQFKSINSSVLSFLYSSTLTSIHDYWKNHSFD